MEIKIQNLFEQLFNSNIFDKNHLWQNFLTNEFSQDELTIIEKVKNENLINFTGISENSLYEAFKGYFHRYGFFDLSFDNFEDGWRYATVEFYYNEQLDLGYIFLVDCHEIHPFNGFSTGEKIFELHM
jgi:hypothetical protein